MPLSSLRPCPAPRRGLWAALLAVLFGAQMAATAACAQSLPAVRVPVYSQIVALPLPPPFDAEPEYEAEQSGSYLVENVPPGETVEDWSQMLTVSGTQGAVPGDADPAALAEAVAGRLLEGYRQACAAPVEALSFDAPPGGAAQATFLAWLGCPDVAGADGAEDMAVLVLIGTQDIYTLQWAERGPPRSDPGMAPRWSERLEMLATAGLCDPVAGEAAPYPSCSP